VGSIVGLLTSDSLLGFFAGWELMTWSSYFLVSQGREGSKPGYLYMLFSGAAGFLILGGLTVFERKIEKYPFGLAHLLIDLLLQGLFRRDQADRIRGKGAGIIAHIYRGAKGCGHRIGGDIVMGRANAAGGEQMRVPPGQILHRRNDRAGVIGHHAHFEQINAVRCQFPRQVVRVGILGAAGKYFIADHQHGGSGVYHLGVLVRLILQI